MKILILTFMTVLCFLSCSNRLSNQGTVANNTNTSNTAQRTDLGANKDGKNVSMENQGVNPDPNLKTASFKVDSYVDDQLESSDFYQNGRIYKRVAYNTQTKTQDGRVRYFYRKDGGLDRVEIKESNEPIKIDPDLKRYKEDLEVQLRIIRSKGIDLPLPDIVESEIRDLSSILSASEHYSDFKPETQINGNQKVIKLVGFNKTGRFHYSIFAYLIGNGDFIKIQDYELTLENGFPTKESLKTDDGELTREYSYKDGKLIGVVYKFTDLENRTTSLTKRFEYHELSQKS